MPFDEAAAVEAMARAIYLNAREGGGHVGARGFYSGDTCLDGQWSLEEFAQAALAALKPFMGGWRTMESAPKETVWRDGNHRHGPHILAYPCFGEVMRVRWWDANKTGETRFCNFIADGGNAVHPTHWMPLPPSPDKGGE